MRLRSLILVLLLSGCSFAGPKRLFDPESVVEASAERKREFVERLIHKNRDVISGRIRASGKVSSKFATNEFLLSTIFVRPDAFRSELFFSESIQLVFIITSSYQGTFAFDTRQRTYYQATDDKSAIESFFGIPFSSEEIALWLFGTFPPASDNRVRLLSTAKGNFIMVLDDFSGRKIHLLLDSEARLLGLELFQGEDFVARTDYYYDESSLRCGSIVVPARISIQLFEQDITVTLRPDRCLLNDPTLPRSSELFKLKIPSGARTYSIAPNVVSPW